MTFPGPLPVVQQPAGAVLAWGCWGSSRGGLRQLPALVPPWSFPCPQVWRAAHRAWGRVNQRGASSPEQRLAQNEILPCEAESFGAHCTQK